MRDRVREEGKNHIVDLVVIQVGLFMLISPVRFHSFVQQIFMDYLLDARHSFRKWGYCSDQSKVLVSMELIFY